MVDTTFVRLVEDCCDKALCALGAKRPRRGTRFFEINKDVLCWVGLNQGKHENFVRINPFVGIHIIPVMKLESEFDGVKYKKGDYATISVHLGELCPDVDDFKFYEGMDIQAEAERLAETVFEFGLEFAKQYDNVESVIPKLIPLVPKLGGYPERLAISYYLSGNKAETESFISERKVEYKAKESEGVQQRFDKFSSWLLDKMETSSIE
ncbi:MAG: hypothetical protein GY928_01625 [Colwellia sp.]|nr:hypothetical protein [Colwellia sp.]